jgi:hypothetical protein
MTRVKARTDANTLIFICAAVVKMSSLLLGLNLNDDQIFVRKVHFYRKS